MCFFYGFGIPGTESGGWIWWIKTRLPRLFFFPAVAVGELSVVKVVTDDSGWFQV